MRLIKLDSENSKQLLIAVLESASGGMDIGEVRRSIKLIDKVQASTDTLMLEDAEYEYLKHRYMSTKFTRVTKEVVVLADSIENAAVVDVTGN